MLAGIVPLFDSQGEVSLDLYHGSKVEEPTCPVVLLVKPIDSLPSILPMSSNSRGI